MLAAHSAKIAIILISLLSILSTTTVYADEATCRSVLHDCDSALQASRKENAIDKQIIADQNTVINTQHSELEIDQIWKPLAIGGMVVSIGAITILVLKH